MKIGIFGHLGSPGGSELRCAEMANGIARHTGHDVFLLGVKNISLRVLRKVDASVHVRTNVLADQESVEILYEMDKIIVVNCTSRRFTTREYWKGRAGVNSTVVDLSKIKAFVFLFNLVLYPAATLPSVFQEVRDIKIVTANTTFFREISVKNKYKGIRHLPRLMLESPIDPASVSTKKKPSNKVRIGQYSMPQQRKFNEEIGELVSRINEVHSGRVSWSFMGLPSNRLCLVEHHHNVVTRDVFELPVKEFLEETDIFLFYRSWGGFEPWSRAVAEALASGCPVVATDGGGTRDQVVPGKNGYLCRNLNGFVQHIDKLINEPELIRKLGKNAALSSEFFRTENVVRKLMGFIEE